MKGPSSVARTFPLAILAALLWPQPAPAQVFVYPRPAEQSQVRYFDFHWRHLDLAISAVESAQEGGAVRLYFYEREREVAERAAASISHSYQKLAGQFRYVPTRIFPYVLYSSYQEFLETNLFPLEEGVLGVTSPRDLKLTLPYFGDSRLFERVSAHEMAHQFTIQKVRTVAEKADVFGEPLEGMPLWFIEGLAEFYTHGGLDSETDMLVRDLLINPDVEQGYAMLDFFEDRIQSFLWTYKVGQARCAFLEETYGPGTIQKILEASPALVAGGSFFRRGSIDFKQLLESLTQDSPQRLAEKFQTWMKRRAFPEYLTASQDAPTVFPLHPFDEPADALSSSPDGAVLLYRSTDMDTGHTALTLAHWRAPDQGETIAVDNAPGSESLHAGFGRNFEVKQTRLVWVAQANGRDVLRVAPYRSGAKRRGEDELRPKPEPAVKLAERASEESWDSELWVGGTSHYDIRAKGIWAAFSPSLSPDEKRLAFIGMDDKGVRDVYVLNLEAGPKRLELSRITHDEHPEREVSWGPSGLYFTSSATGHGKFNIFKVSDEVSGEVDRVTSEPEDEFDLAALPDGRLLFSRYHSGRANLYQAAAGGIVRQTDVSTGFFNAGPGPDGALWALFHKSGRRVPVRIPRSALEERERLPMQEATPAGAVSKLSLPEGESYRSLALRNWELGGIFGFLGGSSLGIFGRVFAVANDRLRNNSLLFDVSILGDFERTNGTILFINQEHRTTWGFGIFQSFRFRLDRTLANLREPFESYERYYGLVGIARHPFNRFVHVQAELSFGRIHYFTSPAGRLYLALPEENGAGDFLEEWERTHRPRLQTEATVQLGYDTLRRHPLVGPIAGSSLLLETSAIYHPQQGALFANVRVDGEHHFHIDGRSQFLVRAGAGNSLGGRFAPQFFLSSFDTLRAVPFGNFDWLLGDSYFYSTAELRIPLTAILRFVLFSDIEAVAGLDFGGVSDSFRRILQRRVFDYVLGANFYLGPLIFRLHFAHPIDTGLKDGEGRALYPSGHSGWVTNFSLGIAGVPGFFMPRGDTHAHPKGSLMPLGGGGAGQSARLSSPAW